MKRKLVYFFGSVLLLLGALFTYKKIAELQREKQRQALAMSLESSASPNVRILVDTLEIDYLDEKRTLAIYLPKNYQNDTLSYSVVYFFDGQSLFDQKTLPGNEWQLDEVLDSLGQISGEQSIVIGLYNTEDRFDEYRPLPESDRWFEDKSYHGDQLADWIVGDLKPWVDANYRTKRESEATVIGGSSLGGLMAYYMLMTYPKVFGAGIVMSPSFWVNEEIYRLHEKNEVLLTQKIYFNAGELEPNTIEIMQKMEAILRDFGVPAENMKVEIENDLAHEHLTWRNGFKKAYPWVLERD